MRTIYHSHAKERFYAWKKSLYIRCEMPNQFPEVAPPKEVVRGLESSIESPTSRSEP
jgi:hypothetical protein